MKRQRLTLGEQKHRVDPMPLPLTKMLNVLCWIVQQHHRMRRVQGIDRVYFNCAVCHTGSVRDTPDGWWNQLPKYVRAIARRGPAGRRAGH